MKSYDAVRIARAQIAVLLQTTAPADMSPQRKGALNGIYAALGWVLEIPGDLAAAQMEAFLGGTPGRLIEPVGAIKLGDLGPGPRP